LATGGPARPQHVRADVGPLPAGQRVLGGPVQDQKPDSAVRGPAGGPVGRQRVPGGGARRPPRHAVHVFGRVDRFRARRPAEPELHGGVCGPGSRFHGVQVVGGIQAVQERTDDVAVQAQPVRRRWSAPRLGLRVRLSRARGVHQPHAMVRRPPKLSVRRGRGRPRVPDKVAVVQGAPVVRTAGGRPGPGRRRLCRARVHLLPEGTRIQTLRRTRTGHREHNQVVFDDRLLTAVLGRHR